MRTGTDSDALQRGQMRPIEEKLINVVFRLDDYSALSATDMELKILDLFQKNKASITFGVVPHVCAGNVYDPSPQDGVHLSAVKGNVLRAATAQDVLETALHGYSHQSIDPENYTEFSHLDYPRQLEKITRGKEFLERITGKPVTTFIPPWNQYDANTLRVLEDLDFSTISAAVSRGSAAGTSLKFLPETCDLLQVRHAVRAARSCSDNQPVIVVLFHLFDFQEVDRQGKITYREFAELVNWLGSEEDVRMVSVDRAATIIDDLSAPRFSLNKHIRFLSNLLPPFLRPESRSLYREGAECLKEYWPRLRAFYLALVILGILSSFWAGEFVLQRSAFIWNVLLYGSTAASVITAAMLRFIAHTPKRYWQAATAGALVWSACIGTWLFSYVKGHLGRMP